MKAFLLAVLAVVVISVAAPFILTEIGFSSRENATVGDSVRLDDTD